MITHEEAREKLLCHSLILKNGLVVGDTYKFISDYISQQEEQSKKLERLERFKNDLVKLYAGSIYSGDDLTFIIQDLLEKTIKEVVKE